MKLIVSEKEIAAKRIAKILSGNGVKEEKHYGIPVYAFKNGKEEFKSIGLKGHIMQVDFPDSYSNWFKINPADLIEAEIVKKPIQKKIIQALKKVSGDAQEIIIATDFDREGELIGYDATEAIKDEIGSIPIRRARFSAITSHDINQAFSKLETIDLNLAFAGRARQDIDLIWGATLTRFISLISYQTKDKFLSVGRVQTPTLAIIVERELEIDDFIVTPYWQVRAMLSDGKNKFDALYRNKKILNEDDAKKIFSKIGSEAKVTQVKESVKKIRPPAPFNTTSLIVSANSLGFSANKTINTAENLYINGYISYPRTDNTVYPPSIGFKDVVEMFSTSGDFKDIASEVLELKEIKPSRGNKKTTDHPPIYPASVAYKDKINSDEWKLYELIVRRFMATLLPEATVKNVSASFDIGGERFSASGSTIIKGGWMSHYPYYRYAEAYLPHLEQDQVLSVIDKEILAKETKPPSRYSQGRLVEKMEELGLGTKATRHNIIQALLSRGYIKGNPLLEPSEKAIAVIKALKENALKITSPDMTAELEFDMDQIANGDQSKEKVVDMSRNALKEIMETLVSKKEAISKVVTEGVKKDLIVGKCIAQGCDGDLIIRQARKTKKKFIGCNKYPDCTTAFPLPQFGMVVTTENKCKICNYPVVKIIRKGKRPWDLCINTKCPSKDEDYKSSRNKKKDKEPAD